MKKAGALKVINTPQTQSNYDLNLEAQAIALSNDRKLLLARLKEAIKWGRYSEAVTRGKIG